MKKTQILAIIPARSGSKGLRKKNLKKINKLSLVEHTINQAKKSKYISEIAVSTDSKKIMNTALRSGVWCKKLRSSKISGDNSKLYHAINFVIKNIKSKPDIIIELHPTHVFRTSKLIDDAIKKFLKSKIADSLISIIKIRNTCHPDYVISKKKDYINFNKSPTDFNRHFLIPKYQSSGIILISKFDSFKKNKSMVGKKCIGFVIEDKLQQFDINDEMDYKFSKFIIEKCIT
ncbi:acylneuraminate cytidylyltransferase family protein [Candidatus Pelagibacter sp. HIMB1517]|uniref:acylneuraminate cytidylyltransferase family protein n=1 Tax=Candidatus Pelagibacter sp. HIMB1517 TaxID=3413341 RepID=UPI003F827D60